jgi:cytochrome c553
VGKLLATAIFVLLAPDFARAAEEIDFARDVRPVLVEKCVRCHGAKKQEGGLRLDIRRRAFVGGDSGPGFVAGSPRGEVLKRVATADAKHRMPPDGDPLSDKQIAALRAWAEQGAKWPDALAGKEPAEDHWAFRPVRRPAVPEVRNPKSELRNEIDRFILAKLDAKGLALSPEADRRTLIRRVYLDLIGLLPTPEEVEAFAKDTSSRAYEKVVDRLLASEHFGERWGRHWLDLARFAESDGYENDNLRPDAWRFRDWVINAINADMPFDRFTIEQLAGDLLPDATTDQKIAAGFHRNTLWNSAASADKEEFRTYAVKDRVDTTGAAWMGLTLGCARCHSHKYDPVAHREYYQLYAFFNQTDNAEVKLPDGKSAPTLKNASRKTHVHTRGNFLQSGEAVTPATPVFLPPMKPRDKNADRLDLARWLADPAHPLTARVAVNHVWQHLFGTGIVPTPENFGTNGEPPAHPDLLDWLASEFQDPSPTPPRNGEGKDKTPPSLVGKGAGGLGSPQPWSRKAVVRLIVLSATYRQSSVRTEKLDAADPGNALLGRQNRFRVEGEIVRDLSLGASGLLNPKLGGPSIVPPFPDGLLAQRFTNESLKMPGPDRHRRGVYIHVQRTLPHPTLAVFDGADGNQACPQRDRTVTPLQALTLLNDPVFVECARALGTRLQKAGDSTEKRIRFGFAVCLGREPKTRELAVLTELVDAQRKLGAKDDAVWFGVARTLLNLEEFTTRE